MNLNNEKNKVNNIDNIDNIDNIILECENEDNNYYPPEKMTDGNGKNLYAYVTYVMLEDYHIGEAIVLAQSLINTGCECDRVVLVTQDISQDSKDILKFFYTTVLEINYLHFTNLTKNHIHNKYINILITKFYAFNLTQYKKILLIAPNTIILNHPMHIFTLNTPAGILADKNLILDLTWYNNNCKKLNHGKKIDKSLTDLLLSNYDNHGINGDYLLLKPELGLLDEIILDISSDKYQKLLEKYTYPDQQYLTIRFSGEWTHVNPRFLGNNGIPHWKTLFGTSVKIASIDDFKDFYDLDIFILWNDIYRQILNNFPELNYKKSLLKYNHIAELFIMHRKKNKQQIHRNIINYLDESYQDYYSKYNIKNTYKKQEIHKSQENYYHLDRFNSYNMINPQVMFPDIEEYDYISPIAKLSEYFGKDNYYEQILSSLSFSKKKSLYKYNYLEPHIRDLVMLEYCKCRELMYIIMLLPNTKHELKDLENVIKYAESIGSIPYIKTISTTKNQLKNLLFWWFHDLNFQSRLYMINTIFSNINILDEHNPVTFIFFDDVKKIKLGFNPDKKEEILNNIRKKVNVKYELSVLMNNYFYETIEFAELILNNNSLELLKYQNTDKLSTGFMSMSNLQYQTFRNAIYNNFSLLEISRIIVIDDVGLYSLGIRNFKNIDAVFISKDLKDNSEYEKYMESVIYDNFANKETKIKFINLAKENTKYYNKNMLKNIKLLLEEINIKNLIELTTNPQYYYYYQGVKLINISSLIQKYLLTYTNSKLLDLLFMSILYTFYTKDFMHIDIVKKELIFTKKYNNINKIELKKNLITQILKDSKLYIKNDLKIIKF